MSRLHETVTAYKFAAPDKFTTLTSPIHSRPAAPSFTSSASPYFAMSSPSPFNEQGYPKWNDGEHIGVHLTSVNANYLFQIPSGPGRRQARDIGNK
jgi:hypothetical protein